MQGCVSRMSFICVPYQLICFSALDSFHLMVKEKSVFLLLLITHFTQTNLTGHRFSSLSLRPDEWRQYPYMHVQICHQAIEMFLPINCFSVNAAENAIIALMLFLVVITFCRSLRNQ